MLLITRGSHAYKIIMLLLITGEFPFRSLGLLGNERSIKETAVRMTQLHDIHIKDSEKTYRCRLITISGKSTLKTLRLCRAGFELIADEMPDLFKSYLLDTNGHRFHSEPYRIERHHRIGNECFTHKNTSNICLILAFRFLFLLHLRLVFLNYAKI